MPFASIPCGTDNSICELQQEEDERDARSTCRVIEERRRGAAAGAAVPGSRPVAVGAFRRGARADARGGRCARRAALHEHSRDHGQRGRRVSVRHQDGGLRKRGPRVSVPVLPAWLSLSNVGNNGTARLSGTPTQAQVGNHAVSLLVTNTRTNTTATQSFTITVINVNDAPVITGQTPNPIPLARNASLTIVFSHLLVTDPDHAYPTGFTLTVLNGIELLAHRQHDHADDELHRHPQCSGAGQRRRGQQQHLQRPGQRRSGQSAAGDRGADSGPARRREFAVPALECSRCGSLFGRVFPRPGYGRYADLPSDRACRRAAISSPTPPPARSPARRGCGCARHPLRRRGHGHGRQDRGEPAAAIDVPPDGFGVGPRRSGAEHRRYAGAGADQ